MRRDKILEEKIALAIEDTEGSQNPLEIPGHTQEEIGYHMWLMIGDGLLTGVDVTSHGDRNKQGLATGLTSKGHDLAERLRARSTVEITRKTESPVTTQVHDPLRLFISHSSNDKAFAKLLVGLLRESLNLRPEHIRCTSLEGHKLPGGADIDAEVRREVHDSVAFIGLLSEQSLRSQYVLFELGARWGARRRVFPLLIPGTPMSLVEYPLKGLNVLDGSSGGDVHQLVTEIGRAVGSAPNEPASYHGHVEQVVTFRASLKAELPPSNEPRKPAPAISVRPGMTGKNTDWMAG